MPYSQVNGTMALQLSKYGTDYTKLANLQQVGELYSKDAGYHYSGIAAASGELPEGYQGVISSKSPQQAMAAITSLIGDTRFRQCGDPSNQACVDVRNALEEAMKDVNNQIMYTIVKSFAQVVAWMQKLDLGNSQMIVLNRTLLGDPQTSPAGGLFNEVLKANKAEDQMEQQMSGAYGNLLRVISQRENVMDLVGSKLSKSGQDGQKKIKDESKLLTAINLLKARRALGEVLQQLESAMEDIGEQATEMGGEWNSDNHDIADSYETPRNATMGILGILQKSEKRAKQSALGAARLINATYKAASNLMLNKAGGELKDYRGTAKDSLKTTTGSWNSSFTNVINEMNRKIFVAARNENGTLSQNAGMRDPKLKALASMSKNLLPDAMNDLNGFLGPIFQQLAESQSSNAIKMEYLGKLASDVSTLISDLTNEVSQTRVFSQDKQSQLKAEIDKSIGSISGAANEGLNTVVQSVASGIDQTASDLTKLSDSGDAQASNLGDSATSNAASLAVQASQGAVSGINALADASSAASSSGALNQARLKVASDTEMKTVLAVGGNLASALADASDVVGEIKSANAIETAKIENQFASSSNLAISDLGNHSNIEIPNSEIYAQSKSVQQANIDASSALSSVSDLQQSVADNVNEASRMAQSVGSSTNSSMASLEREISSQLGILESTRSAGFTQFETSLNSTAMNSFAQLRAQIDQKISGLSGNVRNLLEVISAKQGDFSNESSDVVGKNFAIENEISNILSDLNIPKGANISQNLIESQVNAAFAQFDSLLKKNEINLSDFLSGESANITEAVNAETNSAQKSVSKSSGKVFTDMTDRTTKLESVSNHENSVLMNLDSAIAEAKSAFKSINSSIPFLIYDLDSVADRASNVSDQIRIDRLDSLSKIYALLANTSESVVSNALSTSNQALSQLDSLTRRILKNPEDVIGKQARETGLSFKNFIDKVDQYGLARHMKIIREISSRGQSMIDRMSSAQIDQIERNMNLTSAEKQVFEVLLGVSRSVGDEDINNLNFWSDLNRRISLEAIALNTSLTATSGNIDSIFSRLNHTALLEKLGNENYLDFVLASVAPGIGTASSSLQNAYQSLQATLSGNTTAWATNGNRIYTVRSFLNGLSQKSRTKIANLIAQIQDGRVSVSEALAQARTIDLNDIQNTNDAVSLLVGSMLEYQQGLNDAFGRSSQRLANASLIINSTVEQIYSEIALALEALQASAQSIASNISGLSALATNGTENQSKAVADLEQKLLANQSAVITILNQLNADVVSIEGEMHSSSSDYENYIDSIIAREAGKTNEAAKALQRMIFNSSSSPSSLLEKPIRHHSNDLNAIRRDLEELEARQHRRGNRLLRATK